VIGNAASGVEDFVQVAVARVVVFARAREALLAEHEAVEPLHARSPSARREPLARARAERVERVAHAGEVEVGILLGGDQRRAELELGRAEILVASARELGEAIARVRRRGGGHRPEYLLSPP
jgi:hypothetical protein